MSKQMDLDGFLGHTTRGPTANFLDGWKKRNPPMVNIVLHTRAPIMAVWQHPWPKIVTREKNGKEVREVWSGAFNSWETEDILTKQYKRLESGEREFPPQICPMSIFLEEVHRLWKDGSLEWDTELFRFVGDDPTKAKVLHVAGMLNQTGKVWEQLTDAQKRDAKKRGIPGPSDAWMETMLAKCQYVFTVVDYDNLKDGIQIAKETTLVGDKMKKVIRDRMTSEGEEAGHPFKNPYVFQWSHDATAKQFQDKYNVVAISPSNPKFKITADVLKLIRDTDPPDISRYTGRGNIEDLRASMEDAYCGPEGLFDWDFIFGRAEELAGSKREAAEPGESGEDIAADITGDEAETETEAEVEEEAPEPAPAPKAAPRRQQRQAAKPPAEDPRYVIASREDDGEGGERCLAADGMELFCCDECQTIVRADETECRKCGMELAPLEPEDEPEPEPPPAPKAKPAPAKPSPQAAKAPASAAKPAQASKGTPTTSKPATAAPKGAPAAETKAKAGGRDKLGF